MVILIAPETDIENEIIVLHQLFKAGLECFHLRKPNKNIEEYANYLNEIEEHYHPRIMVHQYHELIKYFNLKGLHFQETKRRETTFKTLNTIRNKQNINLSSSFHSVEELVDCKFNFDYNLLSPVFSSISKTGYAGRGFNVNAINKPIIGMGGVTTKNLSEFKKRGFKGVGVLGGIWHSKTPIENFEMMKRYFE